MMGEVFFFSPPVWTLLKMNDSVVGDGVGNIYALEVDAWFYYAWRYYEPEILHCLCGRGGQLNTWTNLDSSGYSRDPKKALCV